MIVLTVVSQWLLDPLQANIWYIVLHLVREVLLNGFIGSPIVGQFFGRGVVHENKSHLISDLTK